MSCKSCGLDVEVGNATEFFVDEDGVEKHYGHHVCVSPEAGRLGIAGYWMEQLCWNCGRLERDSIRLTEPCTDPVLAWSLFPPAGFQDHPRMCPDCGGILCDVHMLQMFLEYRVDPETVRSSIRKHLAELASQRGQRPEDDSGSRPTCDECEHPDEHIEWLEEELRNLATVQTDDEMILYRLGMVPTLPAGDESMVPLVREFTSACDTYEELRKGFLAEVDQPSRPTSSSREGAQPPGGDAGPNAAPQPPGFEWFDSPLMKAKRALDHQIEVMRMLKTHLWVGQRLVEDAQGTLAMFRERCPKCKSESLAVDMIQT
jgi:hypothetical protein